MSMTNAPDVETHHFAGAEIKLFAAPDGSITLLDYAAPAGFAGPPMHTHESYDEMTYVLAGTPSFRQGDEATVAGPGSVVWIKGTIPHTFANLAAEPASDHGGVDVAAELDAAFKEHPGACRRKLAALPGAECTDQPATACFKLLMRKLQEQENVAVRHAEDHHGREGYPQCAQCLQHLRPGRAQYRQQDQRRTGFRTYEQAGSTVQACYRNRPAEQRHLPADRTRGDEKGGQRDAARENEHAEPHAPGQQPERDSRGSRQRQGNHENGRRNP